MTGPLIHNHYPKIAEAIRLAQGRDSRAQRNAKQLELKAAGEKARELRQEIAKLRSDVSRLASINEVLLAENAMLRGRLGDSDVVPMVKRRQNLRPRLRRRLMPLRNHAKRGTDSDTCWFGYQFTDIAVCDVVGSRFPAVSDTRRSNSRGHLNGRSDLPWDLQVLTE